MEAVDEVICIDHIVEPGKENRDRYRGLYAEYRAAYEALAPIYRRVHFVS
jgi:hypothetical protein